MILDPSFTAVLEPRRGPISQEQDAHIERLWQQERLKSPSLFEGQIFSATSLTPSLLKGEWIPYRYLLALPSLTPKILPTAVNGITRRGSRVLFALRSASLLNDPGYWEIAPSGGVAPVEGRVDLKRSLLKELLEETSIEEREIVETTFFLAIQTNILELFALIDLKEGADLHHTTGEYCDFLWVEQADLSSFIKTHRVLPLSCAIVKRWGEFF